MKRDALDRIRDRWTERALSTGRIAAQATRLAARQVVGARGIEDGLIGEALAAELDQMKGMAMKVGQILSYFDGVLPPETHKALQVLQTGTAPVAWEAMARVLEEAFGERTDALFEAFDPEPLASASIGQVYRARHQGEDVAVKIQYPGVRATIDGDFGRVAGLARLASLATAVDGVALTDELRARFIEECDYRNEARNQQAFADAFTGDPTVLIPRVYPERSRETVLTTAFAPGRPFYTFVADAPPPARCAAGLTLARFAWRSLFGLEAINADPHPGNYLFPDGDAVVFLDFGCVRRFTPAFAAGERAVAEAVLAGRRDAFRDAVVATGMTPRPDKIDWGLHWELYRHLYAPYLTPRFHFTFEHIKAGTELSKPGNPNMRQLAIPPQWIWVQRLQFGLHAVLARLDAEGPYADVLREALAAPRAPLAPS